MRSRAEEVKVTDEFLAQPAQMSTQNQNSDTEKANTQENAAHKKLNSLENQFVSLSSQRQLNLILGSLILISALIGVAGILISLVLGTLMIIQAATGNMIMNDFFDSLDTKYKKGLVPVLFCIIALIVVAYLVIGFTASPAN